MTDRSVLDLPTASYSWEKLKRFSIHQIHQPQLAWLGALSRPFVGPKKDLSVQSELVLRKLVTAHYCVEIIARLPTLAFFHYACKSRWEKECGGNRETNLGL